MPLGGVWMWHKYDVRTANPTPANHDQRNAGIIYIFIHTRPSGSNDTT